MKKILVVGSLNMDYVINVDNMPKPGETVSSNNFELFPGGKGANQAYTIGSLGGNVSMLGAVGNDENGRKILRNLSNVNVDISNVLLVENESTGTAFITVDKNGENSIIVVPGANKCVTIDYINKNIELIKTCDYVVVQLEVPILTINYVVKVAKSFGKTVILDPAPAINNLPTDLIENSDIIKPNETELLTLCNKTITDINDIKNYCFDIIGSSDKKIIVSLGKEGSLLIGKDIFKKYDAIKVNTIDTTAAGDSFTGALAFYLSNDKTIDDAISFATLTAALVVTKKGAQNSIPSYKEVMDFKESING